MPRRCRSTDARASPRSGRKVPAPLSPPKNVWRSSRFADSSVKTVKTATSAPSRRSLRSNQADNQAAARQTVLQPPPSLSTIPRPLTPNAIFMTATRGANGMSANMYRIRSDDGSRIEEEVEGMANGRRAGWTRLNMRICFQGVS